MTTILDTALEPFQKDVLTLEGPVVVELGVKRSNPSVSTLHTDWVPNAASWIGTDIEPGKDVDIIADVHTLSSCLGEEMCDIVISCSTFEHIKYPFLAAHEIMKVLRVGGLIFLQTHQTFPLHAYPSDFFRFSKEALGVLFPASMGFEVIGAEHVIPALIHSENQYTHKFPAFLNSCIYAKKVAPTPEVWQYELSEDGC